jgi:isoleucyl-tRNA synthetase
MPAPLRPPSPVALEWAPPPREWHDVALAAEWAELRAVRSLVNRAVEPLRASQAIKTALQAEVTLSSDSAALTASLHRNASELNDVFVCGSVTLAPWDAGALATEQSERTSTLSGEIPPSGARLRAQAQPTRASKCPRCWRFTSLHACGVCPRCREVVVGQGQLQLVEQLLRRDAS